ncbi:PEP/pyruvate-binding domain-containing protein [Thermomicrobium sp. 4228-Ro]|uniref:PEP/pyruvate-binding domain-containing protein n=1 Tax=Thermomicrobium sp. 4228-Ro TaxID=2993937 RepID=UPI002249977A|nr:PEP/pyruvate-binding domain-containing protein [Thermomicrobium sp. 4228-Ro]MCX2727984.1 PEP/pyruvate-binding domain-containing protein [Thermomicrobium sp. 4228-Ro]
MSRAATVALVRWFHDPACTDVAQAGGKGASLARLAAAGLPVPPGFVVTSAAFATFLAETGLAATIRSLLQQVDPNERRVLEAAAAELRRAILTAPLPIELDAAIAGAYAELGHGEPIAVAVRSSAVAEDSQQASFAGQQETFLDVRGVDAVLDRVRACWASFFSPRALFYRARKGSLDDLAVAVVVQELVEPEKAGVLFTVDPVQRRRDVLVIEAVFGFGEALVSGEVTPDHYEIERTSGRLLRAIVPVKRSMTVRAEDGGLTERAVPDELQRARVLDDRELATLRELAEQVEAFFGSPQDVEWAIARSELFVLQSRPITTLA